MNSLISHIIPSASADTPSTAGTAGATSPPGNMSFFIILGVMILFMYFAIWRPQSKRAREQRNLLDALAAGDEIVLAGGILGTIAKISENYIKLTLAEGIDITVQKSAVVSLLPKGTLKSL